MKDQFYTASGRKCIFSTPRVEDISIKDISISLSQICRYNGHTVGHYSVAQHSILTSYFISEDLSFAGLLHNAYMSYISDCIKCSKQYIGSLYTDIVNKWIKTIATHFASSEEEFELLQNSMLGIHPTIQHASHLAKLLEQKYLFPGFCDWGWSEKDVKFLNSQPSLKVLTAEQANKIFLNRYNKLRGCNDKEY